MIRKFGALLAAFFVLIGQNASAQSYYSCTIEKGIFRVILERDVLSNMDGTSLQSHLESIANRALDDCAKRSPNQFRLSDHIGPGISNGIQYNDVLIGRELGYFRRTRFGKFLPLVIPRGSVAPGKRDIRGFHRGMTENQYKQKIRSFNCDLRGGFVAAGLADSRRGHYAAECKLSEHETLFLSLTRFTEPRLLNEVRFRFHSGSSLRQLAEQVTGQFGVEGRLIQTASNDPSIGEVHWILTDDVSLFLDGRGSYVLTLSNAQITRMDSVAEEQRRRNMNPKPKF